MATSNKTLCETCGEYVIKLKRHVGQVHQNLPNEESQRIILLAKLLKKQTNNRKYFYCKFQYEDGERCNAAITEEGYRHHLLRVHKLSIKSLEGRNSAIETKENPVQIETATATATTTTPEESLSNSTTHQAERDEYDNSQDIENTEAARISPERLKEFGMWLREKKNIKSKTVTRYIQCLQQLLRITGARGEEVESYLENCRQEQTKQTYTHKQWTVAYITQFWEETENTTFFT